MKTIEQIEINECFIVESKNVAMYAHKYQLIERTENTILLRDVDKYGLIQLSGGCAYVGDKGNARYITKDFFSKYRIIE